MQYDTKSETAKKAKRLRGKHKSAQSGEFVSHEEAAANPDGTYKVGDTFPDWMRQFYGIFSPQVLERMQEQLTESGNPLSRKTMCELVLAEVLESKRD